MTTTNIVINLEKCKQNSGRVSLALSTKLLTNEKLSISPGFYSCLAGKSKC